MVGCGSVEVAIRTVRSDRLTQISFSQLTAWKAVSGVLARFVDDLKRPVYGRDPAVIEERDDTLDGRRKQGIIRIEEADDVPVAGEKPGVKGRCLSTVFFQY